MNRLVMGEYLVWKTHIATFFQTNLVCPALDQVSMSKSGFQTASPPLFVFMFLGMRHFVSLLGIVAYGVHSVLCVGGNVETCQGKTGWNMADCGVSSLFIPLLADFFLNC